MTIFWRKECGSETNTTWFVGVEAARISVLAPPGVSVSRCMENELDFRRRAFGWRWAIWNRERADTWPAIDEDRPTAVREIDTVGVLRLLGNELRELVWRCLWAQLQVARRIGRQRPGRVPSEDLAHAGVQSVAWLSRELTRAFPDRAHLLATHEPHRLCDGVAEVPDDPTELIQPLCAHINRQPSLREGGPLRGAMVRWIAWKLLERHQAHWEIQRYRPWMPGDHLDGCPICLGEDPGDRSSYSWGSDSIPGSEPATEDLIRL